MIKNYLKITTAIKMRLDGASVGNAKDALIAAALIYSNPQAASLIGVSERYESLLSQVLLSQNAELIVIAAEEMTKGKYLAVNGNVAQRFFEKANRLSLFMGNFVLGQLTAPINKNYAIQLFRKAEESGHIASRISRHRLMIGNMPLLSFVFGLIVGISDYVYTLNAIRKKARLDERFWRYRDVFPSPLKPVDEVIGLERIDVFGLEEFSESDEIAR